MRINLKVNKESPTGFAVKESPPPRRISLRESLINVETTDYSKLENKPQIEGTELVGNRSLEDIGLQVISDSSIDEIIDSLF